MTSLYHTFIGIDIGKFDFVVALQGHKKTDSFENTEEGISQFFASYETVLENSFTVLEATGGYESLLLLSLVKRGLAVHRAEGRKIKNFIRSLGRSGKTDKIDAHSIAYYGLERHTSLKLYNPLSDAQRELYELYERRSELVRLSVQEKNRLKAPCNTYISGDIEESLKALALRIETLDQRLKSLIASLSHYSEMKQVLLTVEGIGEKVAHGIMALLPELGSLTGKEIASLCGVAPHPRQSGKTEGYRRTWGGRGSLKSILFLAAMGAARSKSCLGSFYNSLLNRGKKPLVALTALMRKIIVIANARVRDYLNPHPQALTA